MQEKSTQTNVSKHAYCTYNTEWAKRMTPRCILAKPSGVARGGRQSKAWRGRGVASARPERPQKHFTPPTAKKS